MKKKIKPLGEPEYIPINTSRLQNIIEIPEKQVDESKLVKIEKSGKSKTKKPRLKTRTASEEIETNNSKGKYTLIITEKPQAALKIASALGNFKRYSPAGSPYYQLERDNKKIIVACAAGHLFGLESKEKGWPVFNISWAPSYKKNPWTKRFYSTLSSLSKNASEFVVATDYDVEGEVIGWNIIRYIANQKDAKRMKYSTLTSKELQDAYKNIHSTLNWGQAIAGETRHFLDWMYGINLSRALMEAIKKAGSFKIMSVGRVQGPALNLIVKKELEIQKFKSEPYWQVFVKLKNWDLELRYEKDIYKKEFLEEFKHLTGKKGIANTDKVVRKIQPPTPFDLTSLQREAYRLHSINPSRTLQIAQSLYLDGLISYPRTSSQKIPEAIQPFEILKKLASHFKEVKLAIRTAPVEGKKSDPAHPSIYPTGELASLAAENQKIYLLIVKRFIACFCPDAEIENKKITFEVDKKKFVASGLNILNPGWITIYPATFFENKIPDITGQQVVEKSRIEEKMTQPPHRYTPASIITELEKRNLGTKATRASILETLYTRGYVKDQSIEATPLGISLISTLEKYSPVIIDEKLTRDFERELSSIETAKKNLSSLQEKVLKEAKDSINNISADFKKKEENIGQDLVKANKENYKQERLDNTIGQCPVCKKGNLRIIFNKKFRRYFLGCSAYPACKTTFSLPPNGLIKKTDKTCKECTYPILMRITKGKRPWEFCFNPACPTRKEYEARKKTS